MHTPAPLDVPRKPLFGGGVLSLGATLAALTALGCAYDFDAALGPGGASSASASVASGSGASSGGDASCEEPGYACAPAIPAGWAGPFVNVAGDPAPSCPLPWGTAISSGNEAWPASEHSACSACGCSDAQGICVAPHSVLSTDAGCNPGNGTSADLVADGACHARDGSLFSSAQTSSAPAGVKCQASGGIATDPAPGKSQIVCGGGKPGEACSGGTCFEAPPDGTSFCIFKNGDEPCPQGLYAHRRPTAYADVTKGACAACACAYPAASCSASVTYFGDPGCAVPASQSSDASCQPFGYPKAVSSYQVTTTFAAGACALTGGAVTADASPSEPHSICCVD